MKKVDLTPKQKKIYEELKKEQETLLEFTPEQRAYIDSQLKLADEMQLRNGNKLTPFEEVFDKILNEYEKEEESYRV